MKEETKRDRTESGNTGSKISLPDGRRSIITSFLFWTFGLTWLVWIPVAVVRPTQEGWIVPVVLLGAFMPSIVGIILGGVLAPQDRRRSFWNRLFNVRLIKGRYWLFLLLLAPMINIVGFFVSRAAGGAPFELDPASFGSVGALIGFLIFMLLGGPLAEELGWRGFLLPQFLQRYRAVKATLILGVIWIAWHLPLFWIEGTAQSAQGFFTVHGLQWMIEVIALSFIVTWLFIHTGWSTLGAVMIHYVDNMSFTLFAGPDYQRDPVASAVVTGLYVVTAVVLLIGSKQLREGWGQQGGRGTEAAESDGGREWSSDTTVRR